MTSSTLSGERRRASSRRGGMTVLGKVAVPKPINLPSQRLENHGLDPNVEIVPKGTLSWGSRSSSSATNAWGSSSLSPNTDGTSSPSHLSARPSSGGSGTRPSTAGSDRVVESTPSAWGSTSRPSSASGVLASNQTSLTSVRPHSAETRPASSQLSRFAEPLTENSVAWSAARTAEKLGVTQAKNDEFSLSSGDFPTLGSEKDKSVKNTELQDHSSHSRPGSSSGHWKEKSETSYVDEAPVNANVKGEAGNSWRRDCPAYSEDGDRPSIEKLPGPQPYPNAGIPPPHYEAWHGPPVNNPQGGVWFRGPPGGPPFGNHVAPGGFPMEPFSYYRPHIPPTALGNPPAVPPPTGGPRGHYPKNGDVYRPHMPDAYIRPGVPMRPGFYPGPMAYEGYYTPPMGFCNSNERDVAFMGMAAGPSVYNRYSNQNPTEHGNSQGRAGGYGSAKPLAPEQVESSQPPDTGRPYRVLLKQHNDWDGKNESSNWEDSRTKNETYGDGKDQPRMPVWEDEQRSDYRKNQDMDLRASARGEEACSQTSENHGSSSSVIVKAKSSESTGNIKTSEDMSARKLDGATSDVQEVLFQPSVPKDSSLIQKIEGLNAKARDNSSAKNREEQRNKFNFNNATVNPVENEVGDVTGFSFTERTSTTEIINPLHEVVASGGERNIDSLSFSRAPTSRRTSNGMQGRADHRNKGRSNAQDADGWRKKSMVAETLSPAKGEATNVQVGDHLISVEAYDRSASYQQAIHDIESVQIMPDPSDNEAQRAKMKELAKQRTKQLQEEEEERTRKQKAKALVKLDELNRRTQAMEGSTQKENVTKSAIENKHAELQPSESTSVSGLAVNSNAVAESSGNQKKKNNRYGKSKHKVEEISSLPAIPPAISKEGNLTKIFVESDNPKTLKLELDHDTVQPASISKDPNQYSEQCRNLPNEEFHGRYSQWKPQHSRRMPRNMQINRPAERSQGSDAVMWAPVKPQNKTAELVDESTEKSKIEAVNHVKGDQQVHNNFKNKRAEMERYVPKPVAKEMAQHGSVQQVASSRHQSTTDETVGRADCGSHIAQGTRHTKSIVSKLGSGLESKNGDGRQSKQGKVYGSWRQRGSSESTNVNDMPEALNQDSNSYDSVHGSTDHQQAQKSEMSSVKGSGKHFGDSSYDDSSNNSNSHDSAAVVSTGVIRDQTTSGRGKRVPFRGNKNHDFDHKKNGGETEKIETQVLSTEPSQPDAGAGFTENRGAGERFTSHWQPKFQGSNNQRGNRSNDQNVSSEVVRVNKKDSAIRSGVSFPTGRDKEINDHTARPPQDQSLSGKIKAGQGPQSGNQEAKRERRNAPPEGRPQSPNQVSVNSVEHDPTDMEIRHEQRPSSGFRKNGSQNLFGRGQESRDWKSSGQDNRHHNQLGNRERQGQSLHYEYYPVGPASSGRPKDDNRNGARFRERGQTHSRRGGGNFHVRQGGSLD